MPAPGVPEGYPTVTPYLIVDGAAKLIDFLQRAFGAAARECHKMEDGKIMHAEATIGDSTVMLGDATGEWKAMPSVLHLYVPDADAVYRKALAAGATSVREPADQFYGDRSGGVKDPLGNLWWISTRKENLSLEEIGV